MNIYSPYTLREKVPIAVPIAEPFLVLGTTSLFGSMLSPLWKRYYMEHKRVLFGAKRVLQ